MTSGNAKMGKGRWGLFCVVIVTLIGLSSCGVRASNGVHGTNQVKSPTKALPNGESPSKSNETKRKPPTQPQHGLVTIAFDDGYMTIYDNAFPPMKRLGFVATVNAIADRTMGLDPRYMHREHLLELQSDGWEIASHSVYHSRPLTKMSLSEADYEFKESARQLRSLGLRINSFTYPYDSRNNALENLSKAYYQDVASGGEVANPFPPPDFYFLKRMGIYHHMSVDYVCNKIKAAEQQNSWLILIFHNISDASSAIAYPPDQFRQILEFLHSQPAEVVTQWEGTQLARAYKTSKAAGMKVVQAQKNQSGDSQAARRTARKKGSP